MTKLYVTGNLPRYIRGYGVRNPGDFFEMPDAVAAGYAELPYFDAKSPKGSKAKSEPLPPAVNTEEEQDG
jgi:hypothetical protein